MLNSRRSGDQTANDRVTVASCSRSGINQDESTVGALDQRTVVLADLNEVQDQFDLRLAPGYPGGLRAAPIGPSRST